eukprot:6212150-Amphidinium_carterae.1
MAMVLDMLVERMVAMVPAMEKMAMDLCMVAARMVAMGVDTAERTLAMALGMEKMLAATKAWRVEQ